MKTAILEDVYQRAIKSMSSKKFIELDDILNIARTMQKNEMDTHIVIGGQNGLGKTVLELAIMRKWYVSENDILSNLITAESTISDIVTYILKSESKLCGIDELNIYLDYKQHSDLMQRHLITSFELARSKRLVFLGCVRDPRKLSLNYRNGKVSIVLWVLDRYEEGGSYAAVFIAPASVEAEDRFGFDSLPAFSGDFDTIRYYMEQLPSFIGWMKVGHVKDLVSDSLLKQYKEKKNTAMAFSHVNKLIELHRKGRISDEEFNINIGDLKNLLGADKVDNVLKKHEGISKQTKLDL